VLRILNWVVDPVPAREFGSGSGSKDPGRQTDPNKKNFKKVTVLKYGTVLGIQLYGKLEASSMVWKSFHVGLRITVPGSGFIKMPGSGPGFNDYGY
jgi:hypothetical protein